MRIPWTTNHLVVMLVTNIISSLTLLSAHLGGGAGGGAPPFLKKILYILFLALEAPKSPYHCHPPPFQNPGSATDFVSTATVILNVTSGKEIVFNLSIYPSIPLSGYWDIHIVYGIRHKILKNYKKKFGCRWSNIYLTHISILYW